MASDNQESTTVGGVAGKTVKGAAIGAGLLVAAAVGLAIGGVMVMSSSVALGLTALGGAAIIGWAGTTGLAAAGVVGGGYALAKGVSKMREEGHSAAQEEERNKMFGATLQAAQADAYSQGVNAGQGQVIAKLQEIQQSAYAQQHANFAQAEQGRRDQKNKSNYNEQSNDGWPNGDDDKSNFAARAASGAIKPAAIRQQQVEAASGPKQI
jgi:hypothetical protein